MALSVATVKVSKDVVLPLRIFVNRKQLLQNNTNKPIIQAPLLSNNSIVCLKSPTTRIYLSNNDLKSLCTELKDDLLLILYELSSQEIMEQDLGKLRIGKSLDFQTNIMSKFFKEESTGNFMTQSHIESATRVSKFKYKLRFKHNWEVDIFINNIKKLADIRHFLLFRYSDDKLFPFMLKLRSKRRILLVEQEQIENERTSSILQEENDDMGITDMAPPEDTKPSVDFIFHPIVNLGDCIDIHVLQRPRRHNN